MGVPQQTTFTENRSGKGPSEGIKEEKAQFSQTIKSAFPQDNVTGMQLADVTGGKLRGSPENLEHSLTGTSAVQDGPGAAGPVRHVRIPNH